MARWTMHEKRTSAAPLQRTPVDPWPVRIALAVTLLAAAATLSMAGMARAAMYKWVDEKGVVHYTGSVTVNPTTRGEITGPDVTSSVIYADAIAANSVLADNIYVRDLEMSPAKFVIVPLQGGTIVRRQSP